MKKLLYLFLLLLPIFGFSQSTSLVNISNMIQPSTGPTISVSTISLVFTAVSGNPSSSTGFTITGANLTNNGTITSPGTWLELSTDNITFVPGPLTITKTGGGQFTGQPVNIFARVAAGAGGGSFGGDILVASIGAVTRHIAVTATVSSPSASLSGSPSPLTLTSTSGVQGSSQSYTLTGTNLGSNNVTVTAPAGYLVSLDNSSFAGTQTIVPSGGNVSQGVFVALASSNAPGTVNGTVTNVCTGVSTVNIVCNGTVSSGVSLDSFRINLDTAQIQTGFTNLTGDPDKSVKTGTGGNSNTLTITTISTSNWNPFGGANCFPNNGAGNYLSYAPNVAKEVWYASNATNLDAYNVSFPKFRVSGLLPGHHYTITFFSGFTFSLNANTEYRANNGTTTYGPQSFDGHNYAGTGPGATLTGVTCDGSGNLNIYFNAATGQDISSCSGFIIKQTD